MVMIPEAIIQFYSPFPQRYKLIIDIEEKLNSNQNSFQRQSFFFRQENSAQRRYFSRNRFRLCRAD